MLEFREVAGCDRTDFERSLAAYLDGSRSTRVVEVRVRVAVDRGRWTALLVLTTGGARSTRRLAGASCREVSEAAAFVTAVVVDPDVLARPRPDEALLPAPPALDPEPEPEPEPAPAASEPVIGEPPVTSPAAVDRPVVNRSRTAEASRPTVTGRARRPGGFVRLSGGLEALGMPGVGPQLALAGGLLGRKWKVEVGGLYRAPTRQFSEIDPQAGAKVRLWAVAARGCGVLRPGPIELPLCAGVEAGQAIGAGFGFAGAQRDAIPWVAALVAPGLAWAPRRWLALWAGVELAVPVLGGRFKVDGLGPLFTVAPVSLRASMGVELRFF